MGNLEILEKIVYSSLKKELGTFYEAEQVWESLQQLKEHHLETYEHSLRVGLSMRAAAINFVRDPSIYLVSGLLHDLGKLKVDPEILSKSVLSLEEEEILHSHPEQSYRLIIDSSDLNDRHYWAHSAVRHHAHDKDAYPKELPETSEFLEPFVDECSQFLALSNFSDNLSSEFDGSLGPYTSMEEAYRDQVPGADDLITQYKQKRFMI